MYCALIGHHINHMAIYFNSNFSIYISVMKNTRHTKNTQNKTNNTNIYITYNMFKLSTFID